MHLRTQQRYKNRGIVIEEHILPRRNNLPTQLTSATVGKVRIKPAIVVVSLESLSSVSFFSFLFDVERCIKNHMSVKSPQKPLFSDRST